MDKQYKICSKCIMDTSDPIISFDKDGVCDHCHDYEKYVKPNWHTDRRGREQLEEILKEIKKSGKKNEYDCLLGLSGGVDSSIMLHMAVKEFGLRPLVFHVDGGWNSELAVHNINVMIDKLGLDLFTEVINWEEMKEFQLAFFKSGVPHIDLPQDHAFIATLYHFANKNNIKYILNGGNFSTECVQYPMKYYYYGTDMIHNNDIRNRFGAKDMKSYPFSSIYFHKIYLHYFKGVRMVKPLNYIPFYKMDAISLLEREYQWKPYPQKHFESRFTRFFESYWLPERFGFDPRRVQYSSLIMTGQMTREEAINKIKIPAYDPETIEDDINYIATKLGVSRQELQTYFTMPKKYYWDYKNQQNIFRIGAKVMNALGLEKVKRREK
jgi:N-acetyl sugar amidotransferase